MYTLIYENILACVFIDTGELDRAEPILRKLLTIQRGAGRDDHPDTLRYLMQLSRLQRARGNLEEAESLLRDAVEKGRRILAVNDVYLDRMLGVLSYVLLLEGKPAVAPCREAVERYVRRHANVYEEYEAMAWLGACLLRQGHQIEAEQQLRAACEGFLQIEAITPAYEKPYAAEAMKWLAGLYDAMDRPNKAREWRQCVPAAIRARDAITEPGTWPLLWGWPRF